MSRSGTLLPGSVSRVANLPQFKKLDWNIGQLVKQGFHRDFLLGDELMGSVPNNPLHVRLLGAFRFPSLRTRSSCVTAVGQDAVERDDSSPCERSHTLQRSDSIR